MPTDSRGALLHLFPAIDATAQKVYPHLKGSGKCTQRMIDFVDENTFIITKFTFWSSGIDAKKTYWQFNHPKLKHPKRIGYATLGEVVFFVRNSLTHESEIDPAIIWTDEQRMQVNHGKDLTVPKMLVCGLLMAVVASPVNKRERFRRKYSWNFGQTQIDLDDALWGDKSLALAIMEKVNVENRPPKE